MFSNKGMLMPIVAIHLSRVDAWPLARHIHNDLVAINVSYHVTMCISYISCISIDITGSSFQLMEVSVQWVARLKSSYYALCCVVNMVVPSEFVIKNNSKMLGCTKNDI